MNRKSTPLSRGGIYSYLLFALLSIQCKGPQKESTEVIETEKEKTVYIDFKNAKKVSEPLKLSQFCNKISYIRIDDQPLLGDPLLINIIMDGNDLYLNDKNIHRYTRDGKFQKSLLKLGQGPREVIQAGMTIYNSNKKEFSVSYFGAGKELTFTNDGQYVREGSAEIAPYIMMGDHCTYRGFLAYNVHRHDWKRRKGSAIGPYLMRVEDMSTDSVIYEWKNWLDQEVVEKGYSAANDLPLQLISIQDSCLFYKYCSVDTIFATTDFTDIYPRFVFNTRGETSTFRDHLNMANGNYKKHNIPHNAYINRFLPFHDDKILYQVSGYKRDHFIGFQNSKGQLTHHYSTMVTNDLDNHIPEFNFLDIFSIPSRIVHQDNSLWFLMDAYQFFEEGCTPPFDDLTEESNHVLVRLHLK